MKVKSSICFALTLIMLFFGCLTGCSGESSGATSSTATAAVTGNEKSKDKKVTIKLTHILATGHSWTVGAEKFKEIVEEKTNGIITVEIFANAQLGDEVQIIEGMKTGTIQMAICSTAKSVNFVPELGLADLPFLFRDWDHVHAVLDGEVGQTLDEKMLTVTGLRSLGWWDQGFRNVLTADKQVKAMSDFQGLKIRTPDSETYTKTFAAIGASPTPMAFSELYSGLETGVVDGFEGSFETTYTSNLQDVCKYITITNHIYSGAQFLIQDAFFQGLSEEYQQIILGAAQEAKEYERKVCMDRDDEYKAKLLDAGVSIDYTLYDNELDALQASVADYVNSYSESAGIVDLVKQARSY